MALATAGIGALAVSAAIPAGIVAALIPLGVSVSVARIIARQVLGGTLPGPVIGAASAQAFTEARTYRAAYIVHAAVRVQARVAAGQSLFHAVRAERHLLEGHLRAQAARMDAARTVDRLARTNVWLMWQLGPTRTHTPVCLAAAGHMFPAGQRPLHGWPGSSHPGCLCTSVPGRRPRPGERTVDQVIAPLVAGGED